MNRRTATFTAIVLAIAAFSAQAQGKLQYGAELVYVDGDQLTIYTPDNTKWEYKSGGVVEGDIIPVGAQIATGAKTQVELRLLPNKSIIKLGKGTTFKIEKLAGLDGQKANALQVTVGKLRVIAAAVTGGETFRVRSQSTVCGVRGTDFSFAVPPTGQNRLLVTKGLVDFSRLMAGVEDASSRISVPAGNYADSTLDGAFSFRGYDPAILSEAQGDLGFVRARETDVPGHDAGAVPSPSPSTSPSSSTSPSPLPSASPSSTPAPTPAPTPEATPSPMPSATPLPSLTPMPTVAAAAESPSPVPIPSPAASPAATATPVATPVANTVQPVPTAETPSASSVPPSVSEPTPEKSALMKWLSEFLNAEIGTIIINDTTWAKAVVQPTIRLGKLKAGLYLPIIYRDNLFDPADWYHPDGNDEWSFGTDDNAWASRDPNVLLGALVDAAKDLALKIKFLEYGDQVSDPFFLKVGNLSGITLGHGMLMNGYANDAEFPALRRVGVDIGLNVNGGGKVGAEALVNDLANPEIFGARLLFRVAGKASLGISGIADFNPSSMLESAAAPDAATAIGDPIFSGYGLDLDLPIASMDLFVLKAFADAGAMIPIVRNDYTSNGIPVAEGFKYDVLWDASSNSLRNWGAIAGVMGSIARVFDYRVEYRYSTGQFRHNYFDRTYDANRGRYAVEYAAFLADPGSSSGLPDLMGIYGEGGLSLLNDKLSLAVGYLWPWDPAKGLDFASQMGAFSNDRFHAGLVVLKGLIPVVDVSGSITYDRVGFVSALSRDVASGELMTILFDENTSFKGEIVLPVPKAPMLDLALTFGTAPSKDAQGNVIFVQGSATRPQMAPVISLETRLHF